MAAPHRRPRRLERARSRAGRPPGAAQNRTGADHRPALPRRRHHPAPRFPGAAHQRTTARDRRTLWCLNHFAPDTIHHAPNAAIRKRIGAERDGSGTPPRCRPRRKNSTAWSPPTVARPTASPTGSSTTSPKASPSSPCRSCTGGACGPPTPIERAIQQEIKRRTSKVRVFPNRDALLRLATAVLVEIDEDWATSDRIYINWNNPDA